MEEIPCVIGGREVFTGKTRTQVAVWYLSLKTPVNSVHHSV